MGLELVYWLALGLGLGFLVLSLLLGDLFDFLDLELLGGDFAAAPVFFAAASAFGVGGLLGLKAFSMTVGGSIFVGLGTGALMGVFTALLFLLLRRQQAPGGFELSQLVGQRGRCTVAIVPGGRGRVSVNYAGMTRSLAATSNDQISVGDEIMVNDVVGNLLTVSRHEHRDS